MGSPKRLHIEKLLALLLVLMGTAFRTVHGECNVCSAFNNLACVSRTQFQVCVNGFPAGAVTSCPTGYVCSTTTAVICQLATAGVVGGCNDCNVCDATGTFACTGARTYSLCLGTGAPTDIVGSCAPVHVCNINYRFICGNATIGTTATCSFLDDGDLSTTTSATATTQVNSRDPTVLCQLIGQRGRYPVGNDISSTCRQYLLCFVNNGVWSGAIYTCPGSTFFNSATGLCGSALPARCGGTARTLMFREIPLD